jgi:predicted dehydrogenase
LGRWGQRLVESVQGVSADVCFTHGVSRDPARAPAFARRADLRLTADYAKVLADPAVDGVVLTTPHSHHKREMLAAVAKGKPVYVEKPIALTADDAEEAVAAFVRAGLALGIGFGRRFTPAYSDMLSRIRAGEIGDVLHIEGNSSGPSGYRLPVDNWRSNPVESPAGAMTARGIHALDCMIAIAGPVDRVFSQSDRRVIKAGVDDTTSAALRFANGATGTLTTLFATADLWRVQAFGSKGWLDMQDDSALVLRDNAGRTTSFAFPAIDKERAALETFAAAVRGERPFPVLASEAVNGVAVTQAMVRSAASGQPVDISARHRRPVSAVS